MQVSYPTLNVLKNLIGICKDGEQGFALAGDDAANGDLRALFARLSEQRKHFAGDLQDLLAALDADPEEEGSTGGTLHRWWMDFKAVLTGADEHAILVECERGEDAAVAAYGRALDEELLSQEVRDVIERQYGEVKKSHDTIRALRDEISRQGANSS